MFQLYAAIFILVPCFSYIQQYLFLGQYSKRGCGSVVKGGGGGDVSKKGQVKDAFTMSHMTQYGKGNLLRYYGRNEIAEVSCALDAQYILQVKEGAGVSVWTRSPLIRMLRASDRCVVSLLSSWVR